ncbi:MAG: hypothetical protein M1817_006781 [Caeruleum heppii]|nr:MAG: hypothetical protein M1817_006781 [Caeruleum heppii]
MDISITEIAVLTHADRAAPLLTSLQVASAGDQPLLYIALSNALPSEKTTPAAINVIELDSVAGYSAKMPLADGYARQEIVLGQIFRSNDEFIDATGRGLVLSAWSGTPDASDERFNVNSNAHLVYELVRRLGLPFPPAGHILFGKLEQYAVEIGRAITRPPNIMHYARWRAPPGQRLTLTGANSVAELTTFSISDTKNPIITTQGRTIPALLLLGRLSVERVVTASDELAYVRLLDECNARGAGLEPRCVPATPKPATAVAVARIKGIISTIRLVGEGAAKTAGIAGFIAAPAFIILDLVNKNWIGAGFGAVGLVLGVAATLAVAGPVGWVLGGLVSALFAILPGLFKKHKKQPSVEDATQVIQWAFFGDKDHTGNEECQKQGNPNCTAMYGAGVLSSVFKWNNFDSIAFLLEYNNGYAMSIPEMASAFHVVWPENGGVDGIAHTATISCKGAGNAWWSNPENPDFMGCGDPQFAIKRERIVIKGANQTADQVFQRIIPNPGGDCRLVNDAASALALPDYNLVISGQPVAIACDRSPTANSSGEITSGATNGQEVHVSAGNGSSDGKSGHFISAPAPLAFAPLSGSSAVCLGGGGQVLCLPNGTYDRQEGSMGFDSRKVSSMTVPINASMHWTTRPAYSRGYYGKIAHHYYNTNRTEQDVHFHNQMKQTPASFDIIVPGDPPSAICLFGKANFKGDVACYGVGGQNLPVSIQRKAQSIGVFGKASVWIYAERYGDAGGAEVTTSISDLKAELYGSEANFNQKIVALWVRD